MTTDTSTKKLAGKVAMVTGASRGIGAAIAKRLAQAGAAVVITYAGDQSKAGEVLRAIESSGGRAVAIRADSADADAVKQAVAETVRTLGRLAVLVNNAGVVVMSPRERTLRRNAERLHGPQTVRPGRRDCRFGLLSRQS